MEGETTAGAGARRSFARSTRGNHRTMMNRRRLLASILAASVSAFALVAHAIDRDFTVHNSTGGTIAQLYASPTTTTQWGGDLLGSDVLPNGRAVALHYTPSMYRGQCVFDIKVVDQAGAHVVSGINLCRITDVTFTRDGDGDVAYSAH